MKEEYQAPVLEELDSTLDCQVVAGDSGVNDPNDDVNNGFN